MAGLDIVIPELAKPVSGIAQNARRLIPDGPG
jgi:hypothetical protein